MANRVATSPFTFNWHPKPLAHALARSHPDREGAFATYLSPEDNDWAASFLLAELLLNAKPRRAPLTRERAGELLHAEKSEVSVEQLEARGFLRFVLGRLQIPQSVSLELHVGQHFDQLPEAERIALKRLDQARQDETALLWVAKDDLERQHLAHKQAHPGTPSLEAMRDAHILAPSRHGDAEGYDLLLNDRESRLWTSYLGSRVLGLFWERLVHGTPIESDDEQFARWLNVALEVNYWTMAPRWIRTSQGRKEDLRTRLVDAATRTVLREPDLLGGPGELVRLRWDHGGFGFHGALDLTPPPVDGGSLYLLYDWWRRAEFGRNHNHCREQLDALISLALFYDQDPWALRAVQLLEASRKRPYLMYVVTVKLIWGLRESIAGIVGNLETASIGMHILTQLTVADDTPVPNRGFDRNDAEARKTRIWREAVAGLLGILHLRLEEGVRLGWEEERVKAVARVLAETLVIATESVYQRSHLQAEEDTRRRGAEARLDVLLEEVEHTGEFILFKVAPELHKYLAEQIGTRREHPGLEAMPVADMRVLFWLLRTVLLADKKAVLDPMKIAETLVGAYCRELRREVTPDRSKVVSWVNDAPATLALPWMDLAAFLEQRDEAQQLVGPQGIDLEARLAQTLATERNGVAELQLFHTWIRKTRVHVRILMRIHEAAHESSVDPMISLTNDQRGRLVTLVERRLRDLVPFAPARDARHSKSLFAPDSDYRPDGVPTAPALAKLVVRTFNRFSGEMRNRAFADWLDVEEAPDVLLTVMAEALPFEAQQRADSRLQNVDLDQFLAKQMWVTQIEQVAEAAALLRDRTDVVEKVLAYGDKVVGSGYRRQWEAFAYRMRVMVAYHKRDRTELERIPAPDIQRTDFNGQWLDPAEDTRNFYLALLLIEDQPEEARRLFDDLLRRRPGSASDALNRFSASVQWARKIEDPDERRRVFLRALHEWDQVAPSIPAAARVDLRTSIAYLRLASFDGAKQYGDFDAEWSELDAAQRAQIDLVELGVANARRRDLHDRVDKILRHARPYHTGLDAGVEARFAQIAQDVAAGKAVATTHTPVVPTPSDNIEARRRIYQELPRLGAEEAVRIVGQGDAPLHEFLAELLYEIAAEFLNRLALFAGFKEDQCNDVMVSFLKMRLKFLCWHVSDQTRGGYSKTGKDVGERDWVVSDNYVDRAIFEALRLDSLKTDQIDVHVKKAISGYNQIGVPRVYIVVYYEGASWPDFWTKYWDHVQRMDMNSVLSVQKANEVAAKERNLRLGLIVYDDGSGMPLYVYHLVMNLGGWKERG